MKDRFEKFTFAIFDIEKSWHKIAGDEMAKYGLKGSHTVYLLALLKSPKGLSAQNLCEICGKDKADVSRMMKIMSDKNLIVKEGSHRNNYGGVYLLTDEGKKAAKMVQKKVSIAVEAASGNLSDDARTLLYDTLDQISENLKKLAREGLPK